MADSVDVRSRFEALSPAFLEVTLPRASDFDAVALLRKGNPEEIARAPGRRNLFFDEEAKILTTLKTPQTEGDLRDILPSIELVITAHATDAVPQGNSNAASASGKHDLASQTYPGSSFVDIIPVGDYTYVVFEPVILLPRPRARLQRPAVYFTVTIRLLTNVSRASTKSQKDYLKSFEPLPANVLEPLNHDPALRGSDIYLSETRVTKVTPKPANLDDTIKAIRGASKRAFPAVPALFTRMRYSTLPDSIIASLHVETSQVIAGSVEINNLDFRLDGNPVEPLTEISLPLRTHRGDETIFLYKIPSTSQTTHTQPLSITIQATANLDQGSTIIPLHMTIDSELNLTNHEFPSKRTYHWSRPLNSSSHNETLSVQSIHRPSPRDSTTSAAPTTTNVIFTFTLPTHPIHTNQTFPLLVQCNNLSPRTRRFALVMLSPTTTPRTNKPRPISTTSASSSLIPPPPLQTRSKTPSPDHDHRAIQDLNPDVRIGPLSSGASFETTMKFRAVRAGVWEVGTVRIVDLEERRVVDVGVVGEVVVLDGEVGEGREEGEGEKGEG